MINFIVVTSNGEILRSGHIQEHLLDTVEVPAGTSLIPGVAGYPGSQSYFSHVDSQVHSMGTPPSVDHVYDYNAKRWHDPRTNEQKEEQRIKKIQQARAIEYPDIGDQLDVLWKQLLNPGKDLLPETQDMVTLIGNVKKKYPK